MGTATGPGGGAVAMLGPIRRGGLGIPGPDTGMQQAEEALHSSSDHTRHFLNLCDIYKVTKVFHGHWPDNHCNRSDTWVSILLLKLY